MSVSGSYECGSKTAFKIYFRTMPGKIHLVASNGPEQAPQVYISAAIYHGGSMDLNWLIDLDWIDRSELDI
jgi:hypothetical protein